jgi:hypothetical protein
MRPPSCAPPIFEEIATFPALAREAAYFYCVLLAESGESVSPSLLALIPDDFQTMNEHDRFVGKSVLLDLIKEKKRAGASGVA